MKRRLGSIALILLLAFVVLPGAAQDATPMVDAPDPELCTLRPLTVADLQRIAEIVVEPRPTVTPVAEPFAMPEGEELFTSERKEVEKDIRRAIACVNTGEPLKALAAYTDDWIGNMMIGQGGLNDALIAGLQVGRDLQPEHFLQILSMGDAARLPDDRVAIVVVGSDPATATGPQPRLFLMAEVKPGRFLIDDVIELPAE